MALTIAMLSNTDEAGPRAKWMLDALVGRGDEVSTRLSVAPSRLDLIYVHTRPDVMGLATALVRATGAKLVVDIRGLDPETPSNSLRRGLQRATFSLADAVVVSDEFRYRHLLGQGIPARKLGIIMDAVDPDTLQAQPRLDHVRVVRPRDEYELPSELLECMALGLPAVVAKTRATAHYFEGAEVELVSSNEPMDDAVSRLSSDARRRTELAEAAKRWQAQYGMEVQRRLLFRTIDALCFEKLKSQKKKVAPAS